MINPSRLERRIERHVAAGEIVGLTLALVRGAEVTYARGFGTTSVEDGGLAVTPRTLFCVCSISKSMTAGSIRHAKRCAARMSCLPSCVRRRRVV